MNRFFIHWICLFFDAFFLQWIIQGMKIRPWKTTFFGQQDLQLNHFWWFHGSTESGMWKTRHFCWDEDWKKGPWWLRVYRVYRGWKTTQLCGEYHKPRWVTEVSASTAWLEFWAINRYQVLPSIKLTGKALKNQVLKGKDRLPPTTFQGLLLISVKECYQHHVQITTDSLLLALYHSNFILHHQTSPVRAKEGHRGRMEESWYRGARGRVRGFECQSEDRGQDDGTSIEPWQRWKMKLVGGCKYFLCSSLFGEDIPNLTSIFFHHGLKLNHHLVKDSGVRSFRMTSSQKFGDVEEFFVTYPSSQNHGSGKGSCQY